MKLIQAYRLSLLTLILIFTQPAFAAIEYITDPNSGKLVQAKGVTVDLDNDSILEEYQVTFEAGTFNDIYGGVIPGFQDSLAEATMLSDALLNQVYGAAGTAAIYDTHSYLTNGCLSTSWCEISTPYGYDNSHSFSSAVVNYPLPEWDIIWTQNIPLEIDLRSIMTKTFAVWEPTPPVPEPNTSAMLLIGVVMLGCVTRHRYLF